jgi:histidine triad (HIT) family protein
MDCIFCKIVAGEIPCFKVFDDESTLAFMDINPACEGHLLIVPKTHFVNLFDGDDAALEKTIVAARKIAMAMKSALGIDSINLIQANGPWALQSVEHFHLHLIPRRENDKVGLEWPISQGNMEAIESTGNTIAAAIS